MRIKFISKLMKFSLFIPRIYNGKIIKIPVQDSNKVGISNEAWMNDLIKEIHKIKKIKNFYDVGANLGQTLVKVKTIDNDINYHAFEPNYLCSAYLNKLIAINCWGSTHIYPIGLFHEDSLQYLEGRNDCDKSSSIMLDFSETKSFVKKITSFYSYETIKDFVGNERVDIIKIDTEGSEPEVIKTLESLVKKDLPLIFIEILKLKKDNALKVRRDQDLYSYIKNLGYIVFRINKNQKNKFISIQEVNSLGAYSDNIYADHLLIPKSKINFYKTLVKEK